MNYEPNARHWERGDFVLHDADAKRADMLMVVIGFTRDGLVKTRYRDRKRGRKVWVNPLAVLHDSARFGIATPGQEGDARDG